MEAKAVLRYVRITPRKARRVVDLIRGKRADKAMIALKFMPYRGASLVGKLLRSAMANAEQKEVVAPEEMEIVKAFVDEGPVMKRMRQRAMGRANVIKKKTSHITLVLAE
ncbi:50S ribosomal protein L22 [bacterium BMS3Abin07]|nr:50S ribosomal protein L22 [bacterium BMS3Abin07]GBE33382.1 50S ribosomal protein L22 [bacterium BMS3Bbin05]HDL20436.1 50S ribosomal protein L22 [Nitrospirota bacterium]HDO21933.1 50S ribosomal protein L22 [Nitrospirota bacterium]HDZ87731.1 50S ribosomal protein L22 [Nitrospirota bacterium]